MTPSVRFGAHSVEFSSLDKVLFPESGLTKGDLVDHYRIVAPCMLPHVWRRPLTLQRFPEGIGQAGFYQKEAPDFFPEWIARARVTLEDGSEQDQVTADNLATLAFLGQQAAVTLHVWTSRAPAWTHPDRIVFDLDPGEPTTFATTRATAHSVRDRLRAVGLTAFAMITGSRGIHVWVPIRRGPDFDEVRSFARLVAGSIVADRPADLTDEIRKDKRAGRLFVDIGRNGKGQTCVAPYSLRALPAAPVATPVTWSELSDVDSAGAYTLQSLPRRLARRDDPWKGMGRHAADLARARGLWERSEG
jgi:bifunctional non-homologous end joining protein LigD